MIRSRLISTLMAGALAGAAPAGAAEPPACNAATAGVVACIADRLCRCGFERGGSLVDRPAGHRWDCGVLRPACPAPSVTSHAKRPLDWRSGISVPIFVAPRQRPERPAGPPIEPPRQRPQAR